MAGRGDRRIVGLLRHAAVAGQPVLIARWRCKVDGPLLGGGHGISLLDVARYADAADPSECWIMPPAGPFPGGADGT